MPSCSSVITNDNSNVDHPVPSFDLKILNNKVNENENNIDLGIIIVRTKIEGDSINRFLIDNKKSAKSSHGDKEQRQSTRIIKEFKERKIRILVATDVASRGIHVVNISHIINYDLPDSSETYVHRIGRTGRAKFKEVGGQAVLGRQFHHTTPWHSARHGYDLE